MMHLCHWNPYPIVDQFKTEADQHEHWMRRCLLLASKGAGFAAPNPLVGAVLVHEGRVLAEGWHRSVGGPHAEVECLRSFGNGTIPSDAVLYVNLEPCAHHGRTPPCADLLVQRKVKHVVIGTLDPFPQVAGKGVAKLRDAGVQVTEDVLVDPCRWTQRRFLTSVGSGRPYVILKWARSADGFMDMHPRYDRAVQRISGRTTDVLVHAWRAQEQAILVGSRTVLNDDPSLTVRHVKGPHPLRVVLDREGITPTSSKVFGKDARTLLFTAHARPELSVDQVLIGANEDPLRRLLSELHQRSIRSVLVEGGAEMHRHFLDQGIWDEARVITGNILFRKGTVEPKVQVPVTATRTIGDDRIDLHVNPASPMNASLLNVARWD
ncbi:MAG: bifunctional diaminohydroxyphosphoribosylaminopyrimidine deaminase/5-amino-6-(5-phosphoribosylamino)uracil reductase RibD [Flavobacteriales bacterium]|nr:bifunctional diaminohydroxyphosphoribosylaminopyrimidine deaminase/5-amino-6-(5-phosphoribosylamino)uracil reductase RibD [Flavobacteriales bacterium]